eukprot:scaffold10704_cov21-Tisochrysis_lutea.AAC.1
MGKSHPRAGVPNAGLMQAFDENTVDVRQLRGQKTRIAHDYASRLKGSDAGSHGRPSLAGSEAGSRSRVKLPTLRRKSQA